MFSKEISGLTLTNGIASTLFQNITGNKFRSDESFVATLRALLHSRVPKEESVTLQYSSTDYSAGQLSDSAPRDCVRAFIQDTNITYGENGILLIHSFEGRSEEDNTACFKVLDEGVPKAVKGFKPLDDLSNWIETTAKFRAKVYINEERRCTIVFTEKMNTKRWHMLESLVTRYFPWYFGPNPLNEEELDLVKTLTKRYAPNYEAAIEAFSKKFDFRSQIVRSKLTGFETQFDRQKLENVRSNIRSVDNNLRDLESRFSSYYQQLNDLRTQEAGLIVKIENGGGEESNELLDFFLATKSLQLVNVSGGKIEFVVTTTMDNFDPDAADSMVRNENSFFYYSGGDHPGFDRSRMKRLLKAIFVDEVLKIRLCAAYTLNFASGEYAGRKGYAFARDIVIDHTPNQHIQGFRCLGQNERMIRDSMRQHDYVGAVSACIQSAKSVNVTESTTCKLMINRLFASDATKFIQMPDKTTMTPIDAVKWLEEQDVKAKKEKEQGEESHE